ncbi:hypothetical protein AALO_G00017910 [Alosa alosa]|uniref:Uncharacterized protein n=1 Tax=Alosa alosa TaxID=278164 RepID=A0AAV6HHN0_9TELE|nr:hypothetical protein AALO_G00017910 [Alosa alosa]
MHESWQEWRRLSSPLEVILEARERAHQDDCTKYHGNEPEDKPSMQMALSGMRFAPGTTLRRAAWITMGHWNWRL